MWIGYMVAVALELKIPEVAFIQNDRGCYVLSCNDGDSILRFHFYIVGNPNGWLEGCIGNGVEGFAPLCIIRGFYHERGFLEWDDDRIVVREGLKRDVCPLIPSAVHSCVVLS